MKYVPNAVSGAVGLTILRAKKNSPQLLFAAGIVGFAGTVVMACKATLKVEQELTKHEQSMLDIQRREKGFRSTEVANWDRERQKVLVTTSARIFKLYAPAVGVGAISVVCLTQSHRILTERNTQLTAAFVGLQKFLEGYRGRVQQEIGEEKEREVYYGSTAVELVQDTENGPKKYFATAPGMRSPYAQMFDDSNTNWNPGHDFNIHFLRIKEDRMTDKLRSQKSLMLNEVYDELDMPRTPTGAICGWMIGHPDSDDFVEFQIMPIQDFHGSLMIDFNAAGSVYDMLSGRVSGRKS